MLHTLQSQRTSAGRRVGYTRLTVRPQSLHVFRHPDLYLATYDVCMQDSSIERAPKPRSCDRSMITCERRTHTPRNIVNARVSLRSLLAWYQSSSRHVAPEHGTRSFRRDIAAMRTVSFCLAVAAHLHSTTNAASRSSSTSSFFPLKDHELVCTLPMASHRAIDVRDVYLLRSCVDVHLSRREDIYSHTRYLVIEPTPDVLPMGGTALSYL